MVIFKLVFLIQLINGISGVIPWSRHFKLLSIYEPNRLTLILDLINGLGTSSTIIKPKTASTLAVQKVNPVTL